VRKKWIFFDCMETLIDVKVVPDQELYAYWAYSKSGIEFCWPGFDEFLEEYKLASEIIEKKIHPCQEFSLLERFKLMVEGLPGVKNQEEIEKLANILQDNYWKNYWENCRIEKDLPYVLSELKNRFSLGVISNFKKPGGVEELLEEFSLLDFFDFVITSVDVGWKKPHPKIFSISLKVARVKPGEVIFVGDDFSCDYCGSKDFGMKPVLLDREKKNPEVYPRISSLSRLPLFLEEEKGV